MTTQVSVNHRYPEFGTHCSLARTGHPSRTRNAHLTSSGLLRDRRDRSQRVSRDKRPPRPGHNAPRDTPREPSVTLSAALFDLTQVTCREMLECWQFHLWKHY